MLPVLFQLFHSSRHLKNGSLLYVASRFLRAKMTSPDTYSRRNPKAHQADGKAAIEWLQNQHIQIQQKATGSLRVTREKGDDLEILWLFAEGQEYHYILILDLLRLVNLVRGTTALYQRVLCLNCFHVYMNKLHTNDIEMEATWASRS